MIPLDALIAELKAIGFNVVVNDVAGFGDRSAKNVLADATVQGSDRYIELKFTSGLYNANINPPEIPQFDANPIYTTLNREGILPSAQFRKDYPSTNWGSDPGWQPPDPPDPTTEPPDPTTEPPDPVEGPPIIEGPPIGE